MMEKSLKRKCDKQFKQIVGYTSEEEKEWGKV